jgi:hypothetical protein
LADFREFFNHPRTIADGKLVPLAGIEPALLSECLQAADILAGCAMRFARDELCRNGRVDGTLRSAFLDIFGTVHPVRATGVNLVMSYGLIDRLDLPYFLDRGSRHEGL